MRSKLLAAILFASCLWSNVVCAEMCVGAEVRIAGGVLEVTVKRAEGVQIFSFMRSDSAFDRVASYTIRQSSAGSASAMSRVRAGQLLRETAYLGVLEAEPFCLEDPFCGGDDGGVVKGGPEAADSARPGQTAPEESCIYCYPNFAFQPAGHLLRYGNADDSETAVINVEARGSEPSLTMIVTIHQGDAGIEGQFECVSDAIPDFAAWTAGFEAQRGYEGFQQVWEFGWEGSDCAVYDAECLVPSVGSDYSSMPVDDAEVDVQGGEAKRVGIKELASVRKLLKKARRTEDRAARKRLLKKIANALDAIGERSNAKQFSKAGAIAREAADQRLRRKQLRQVWLVLTSVVNSSIDSAAAG